MKEAVIIFEISDDVDVDKCILGGDGNVYYFRDDEQRASIVANIHNYKLELLSNVGGKNYVKRKSVKNRVGD